MTSASMQSAPDLTVAFIGYGEAATAFVTGWNGKFADTLTAYDSKTSQAGKVRNKKQAEYVRFGVVGCETAAIAVESADVVFSLVTADQALNAAQSVVGHLKEGCLYFDCNSCAPETKRKAAALFNNSGADYVDVAIMSPIYPKQHKTPVLVSGVASNAAIAMMEQLDMSATLTPGGIGAASSIKMVRSIMVKGLEALMAECVLAGRRAGVGDVVLDTLEKTYPDFGWKDRAAYSLERMMVHGNRRAAEMREVALMIKDLGLDNSMAEATVGWQQTIGDLQLEVGDADYQLRADRILDAMNAAPEE